MATKLQYVQPNFLPQPNKKKVKQLYQKRLRHLHLCLQYQLQYLSLAKLQFIHTIIKYSTQCSTVFLDKTVQNVFLDIPVQCLMYSQIQANVADRRTDQLLSHPDSLQGTLTLRKQYTPVNMIYIIQLIQQEIFNLMQLVYVSQKIPKTTPYISARVGWGCVK